MAQQLAVCYRADHPLGTRERPPFAIPFRGVIPARAESVDRPRAAWAQYTPLIPAYSRPEEEKRKKRGRSSFLTACFGREEKGTSLVVSFLPRSPGVSQGELQTQPLGGSLHPIGVAKGPATIDARSQLSHLLLIKGSVDLGLPVSGPINGAVGDCGDSHRFSEPPRSTTTGCPSYEKRRPPSRSPQWS